MWQALLAAALAGTTSIAAKHIIANKNTIATKLETHDKDQKFASDNQHIDLRFQFPLPDGFSNNGYEGNCDEKDGIFWFSSSGSKNNERLKKKGAKVKKSYCGIEQKKSGKRVCVCLKKRKVVKNGTASDRSFLGWGLGVGMMYMMAAERAEIDKLNATVDETAKVVQELKTELCRRKSLHHMQSAYPANTGGFKSTSGTKNIQPALNQTRISIKDSSTFRICDPAVSEDSENASSVLTEEQEPECEAMIMNQLEAEFQSELQKLPLCADEACQIKMNSSTSEAKCQGIDIHENADKLPDPQQFHGVSPFELDNKLSHLLLDQQQNQITKLETELHSAHSKLHQKEAELQALKDCVKRLTEFSLSSSSDEETDAQGSHEGAHEWDYQKMDSESKIAVVGAKRPMNNELCSYYL